MSPPRWKKLRENEYYQLNIAEKYYAQKKWKVALAEYEKFLTLYERSEGGSYAQLKWSLCQVNLRKANTAIKEGFQSVIDYWPDSPDAVAAAYYMANTYRNIGQLRNAKKAYKEVLENYQQHLVASYATNDLLAIAAQEKDKDSEIALLKKLTYDYTRNKQNKTICENASRRLASHHLDQVALDEAVKALATTYPEDQLTEQVKAHALGPIGRFSGDVNTRLKGARLAGLTIAYVKQHMPSGGSEEEKNLAKQHWLMVAELTSAARQNDEVPGVYEQILKTYGNDDAVLARLAAWYKSQKKYDLARTTYRRYENKIEGLNQVALSHREQGKLDLALSVYNQLLGLDADGAVRWHKEMAAAYYAFRKYKETIDVYTKLMTIDLANADSYRYSIASTHQTAGQYKEAIGHYRQCTNFPSNYQQMAYCHRRLKQHGEAILLYNQILGGHEPSAPWALYQIAQTREEAGQKELAIKAFQQVCKRFPKDGHASQAHAHLQRVYKISITLGGTKDE